MAQLTEQDIELIRDALKSWRRKASFESALSSTIRRRGGEFEDYLRIISEIRVKARNEGTKIHDAARALIG